MSSLSVVFRLLRIGCNYRVRLGDGLAYLGLPSQLESIWRERQRQPRFSAGNHHHDNPDTDNQTLFRLRLVNHLSASQVLSRHFGCPNNATALSEFFWSYHLESRPNLLSTQLRVFGNLNGLFNMTLFLLITNVLGALIAVQLFRGDIPAENNMNFAETYTAFLAMYQVD